MASAESYDIAVDGVPLPAQPGDSIAAVMVRAGVQRMRDHDVTGEARGLYCGMGACFDCLVTVDGSDGHRACLTSARRGMSVTTRRGASILSGGTDARAAAVSETTQVLVVGAGPAGLSAAESAARHGARVVVLDERPAPGGQYFKQPSVAAEQGRQPDAQARAGRDLIERVRRAKVTLLSGTTAWHVERHAEGGALVFAAGDGAATRWRAEKLIVATGAFERAWAVPGWTLPGVMTTGAAQTLLRSYGVAPGKRVLIAGNGPLNLQVAAELIRAGVDVVALVEASAPAWGWGPAAWLKLVRHGPELVRRGLGYIGTLVRAGTPILNQHVLVRAEGQDRVQSATVAALGRQAGISASERSFAVDAVLTGYGFQSADDLLKRLGCEIEARTGASGRTEKSIRRDGHGRTSAPGVFVAGDTGGIWGGEAAQAEGALAGLAAAADLGLIRPDELNELAARPAERLGNHRRFQRALWAAYRPAELDSPAADATVLCRCEGLTRASLATAADCDLNTLKRATRAGMGRCQGRYCEPLLRRLLEDGRRSFNPGSFSPQTPVKPIGAGLLASLAGLPAEASSASGETAPLRLDTPIAPGTNPHRPPHSADVVIAGAGIVGICTAYELARAGVSVVVLDRDGVNTGASGANAGSLHVQLLSYALADLESDAARAGLALLRLQRESARRWIEWASTFEDGIEAEITGGMILGVTPADEERIRRVVELQKAAGIPVEFLSGAEARRLAPEVGPDVVAASYSADEGKLNPLLAGPTVARRAEALGAHIIPACPVTGVEQTDDGFVVQTPLGTIRTRRFLNAAGAWSGRIAEMVGIALPVQPNFLQMIVTEPVPPLVSRLLAQTSSRLTLKQTRRGTLIVGGGWSAPYDRALGGAQPSVAGIAGNLAAAIQIVPGLENVRVTRTWAAPSVKTPRGAIIGEVPGIPGFFNAITLNGLTLGPMLGEICKNLLLGRPAGYDLSLFRLA